MPSPLNTMSARLRAHRASKLLERMIDALATGKPQLWADTYDEFRSSDHLDDLLAAWQNAMYSSLCGHLPCLPHEATDRNLQDLAARLRQSQPPGPPLSDGEYASVLRSYVGHVASTDNHYLVELHATLLALRSARPEYAGNVTDKSGYTTLMGLTSLTNPALPVGPAL